MPPTPAIVITVPSRGGGTTCPPGGPATTIARLAAESSAPACAADRSYASLYPGTSGTSASSATSSKKTSAYMSAKVRRMHAHYPCAVFGGRLARGAPQLLSSTVPVGSHRPLEVSEEVGRGPAVLCQPAERVAVSHHAELPDA